MWGMLAINLSGSFICGSVARTARAIRAGPLVSTTIRLLAGTGLIASSNPGPKRVVSCRDGVPDPPSRLPPAGPDPRPISNNRLLIRRLVTPVIVTADRANTRGQFNRRIRFGWR